MGAWPITCHLWLSFHLQKGVSTYPEVFSEFTRVTQPLKQCQGHVQPPEDPLAVAPVKNPAMEMSRQMAVTEAPNQIPKIMWGSFAENNRSLQCPVFRPKFLAPIQKQSAGLYVAAAVGNSHTHTKGFPFPNPSITISSNTRADTVTDLGVGRQHCG